MAAALMRPGYPEMIVKTLSSEIRKGFAGGVSGGHQGRVTVIQRVRTAVVVVARGGSRGGGA